MSTVNLFCGRDIETLELPLKKLLKGDYIVYYNDSDPNFNENDIPSLSQGLKPIKLKSKGQVYLCSVREEGSSIVLYKKKKEIIPMDVLRTLGHIQRGTQADQDKLDEMYNNIVDDIDEDIRRDIMRQISEDPDMDNEYYDLEEEDEEEEIENADKDEEYNNGDPIIKARDKEWEAEDLKWIREEGKKLKSAAGDEDWLTEEEVDVDEEDFQD